MLTRPPNERANFLRVEPANRSATDVDDATVAGLVANADGISIQTDTAARIGEGLIHDAILWRQFQWTIMLDRAIDQLIDAD